MIEFIHDLLSLNVEFIATVGVLGVFLFMAIESSFIPFPSEIIVPPAGYLAARGEMSGVLVLTAAIAGSLAGAGVNYWIAARMGRPFFERWGKWFLVRASTLDKSEAFFARHGEIGTFVGRLVPGVRQLVSLPAGVARMHLGRFFVFTGLGAGIWCAVLYGIGWTIGDHGGELDLPTVKRMARDLFLVWVVPSLAAIVVVYLVWNRRRRAAPPPEGSA